MQSRHFKTEIENLRRKGIGVSAYKVQISTSRQTQNDQQNHERKFGLDFNSIMEKFLGVAILFADNPSVWRNDSQQLIL